MWKTKRRMVINILVGFIFVLVILTFYNTFSMNTEYRFESKVYDIGDSYIRGVSVNTSVELYRKYFDMENCSIKVVDLNNEEIVSGFVVNGSKTILYDTNGNAIGEFINIIKGDFNSDGIIDRIDFYDMGKCLVSDCSMDDYLKASVDIDNDSEFHINDLMLLDKAITLGYTGISIENTSIVLQSNEQGRLVGRVDPGYGVNLNVKWSSLDESIATVDDAGRVVGHKVGETFVKATTLDGKYSVEAKVKVDNTIQLSSYSGNGYIGGNDVVVKIKSVDYEGMTCSVSNKNIADCEIRDKKLVLSPKDVGNAVITVSSSKYGEVTYNLEVISVYLNVMPKYLCTTPNNVSFITVSGFDTGNISVDISDTDIVSSAYMQNYAGRDMLRINFGSKQGRATLKVKEDNGNTTNNVVVDVSYIALSEIGKTTSVGKEVSVDIIGDNIGVLVCKTDNSNIGTCRIEDKKLIVTPNSMGVINVEVINSFTYNGYYEECGKATFLVVVQEG